MLIKDIQSSNSICLHFNFIFFHLSYILFGLRNDFALSSKKKRQNLPRCGQSWNRSPSVRLGSTLGLGACECGCRFRPKSQWGKFWFIQLTGTSRTVNSSTTNFQLIAPSYHLEEYLGCRG